MRQMLALSALAEADPATLTQLLGPLSQQLIDDRAPLTGAPAPR
jgi:hypothetical protein